MIRWGLGQTLDILYILQWKPGCKNYTLRVGLHKAHTYVCKLYLKTLAPSTERWFPRGASTMLKLQKALKKKAIYKLV